MIPFFARKKSPIKCSMCKTELYSGLFPGLGRRYYTLKVVHHFPCPTPVTRKQDTYKVDYAVYTHDPVILCSNCFHEYENFLIQLEVQENHKRNYEDIKGGT